MVKKAKDVSKPHLKKSLSTPVVPADFTLLIQQTVEVQKLMNEKAKLTPASQSKLNGLIKGFIIPDNLSLIQLSVVPKHILTIQASWDSFSQNEGFSLEGKEKLQLLLAKMLADLQRYAGI